LLRSGSFVGFCVRSRLCVCSLIFRHPSGSPEGDFEANVRPCHTVLDTGATGTVCLDGVVVVVVVVFVVVVVAVVVLVVLVVLVVVVFVVVVVVVVSKFIMVLYLNFFGFFFF
jgi:hypothetical protein